MPQDQTRAEVIRVLLAEESPVAAQVLHDMLVGVHEPRFAVDSCTRLSDALQHVATRRPDLVFLSLALPDSQGPDTVRRLRAADAEVPVVILTGLDDEAEAVDALDQGAQYYLVKGRINPTALAQTARHVLASRKLEAERRAAERMRGVLEVAGAICHELNQPMQVISGQAEILEMETADDSSQHDRASRIRTQVTRMKAIIERLRNMTTYATRDYAGGGTIVDIERAAGSADGADRD